MTYRTAAWFVVLLAGCPVGHADDQEIDGGGSPDTPSGTSGLTVTWESSPEVPGPVASDLSVDEVRLEASSLRLIGDSAVPGDTRTTRAPLDLRWREDMGMDQAPTNVEMNAAPSGLYSRIEIGTGGGDEHLVIKGEARVRGELHDFEIDDRRPHAIVKNIVLTLAPGQHKTIPVTIDVAVILASVPFDQLDEDRGTLVFDTNDPRLAAVWAALDASFAVPGAFSD